MSDNRILVVDDDRAVSTGVRITLEDRYEVATAESGEEALNYLAGNKVDLVLMDIKMPKMNGIEALKEIRKYRYSMPVVMLTAYPTEENIQKAWEAGASGFLSKPFELQELRDFVDNAITGKQ